MFLKNGFTHKTFSEISKQVFVDIAEMEMGIGGKKSSMSRISLITGLTRKDVKRIKELPEIDNSEVEERYNHAARVIHAWMSEDRFKDSSGQPKELSIDEGEESFFSLSKEFGGDIHARAILDDLIEVGCVNVDQRADKVKLVTQGYVPKESSADQIGILGRDVTDLLQTLDHNINNGGIKYLQRKVCFDAVPEQYVQKLRDVCREKGRSLIKELERILAEYDCDVHPELMGKDNKKRLGVGIYYFEDGEKKDD